MHVPHLLLSIEPITLGSDLKLSDGRERSFHYRHASKEAILKLAAEMLIFSVIWVVFTKEEFLILLRWILPPSGKSHKMSFLS